MSYEISAHHLIEAQTKRIAKLWKSSRPRPRNRVMGFKGYDGPRKERQWESRNAP